MTKEELNKEIQSLQLRVAACNKVLQKLADYGQSWAFDCREYRINESAKYSYLTQIAKLRQRIKDLEKV
jgi:hypothetical protein